MGKVALIARIILGLIFFVFGLNGFFNFIQPPPMGEEAMAYMGALFATGYFFPVLKIFEIVSGALLLSGRLVPLALLFLAPIVLQIFLFHAFLSPDAGFPLAILSHWTPASSSEVLEELPINALRRVTLVEA